MVNAITNDTWGGLVAEPEPERSRSMREHFTSVLALDVDARAEALEEMVRSEYALEDDALRQFTTSRLRTWLSMPLDDAIALAGGYDAVFERIPAHMAMRRAKIVQTVALHDLTPDEVEGLFALIPSLIKQVPRSNGQSSATAAAPPPEPAKRKRWGVFGR